MKAIAFDLGASSGKMLLGEFDGETLSARTVHRFENRQISLGGDLYWNLLGIYENLTEGIRRACALGRDVVSVGLDTYSNDFAFVGPRGDVVSQMRCYRDPRAARCAEGIYAKISRRELHMLTGNQNALFNTVMQLAAMAEEGERYLFSEGNTMLLLPDLLGYLLTGEKRSEYTISSVTQMFDYRTGGWSEEILGRLGIPRTILPPITPSGAVLGRFTARAAADFGTPAMDVVSVCEHDTASAVAALPTNRPDVAFISSGTWSLVGVELDEPVVSDETFRYNFALEGGVDGRYRLLKNVMGLWLAQECRLDWRRRGEEYGYDDLERLARAGSPFRSLIDPDDGRFYEPGEMTSKIACYCADTGQPVPETPGQFIRCIDESLALKYRWTLIRLERIIGRPLRAIHILGGGSRDGLLDQYTADACGRPVYAGPDEAALTGNLLLQLRAYGEVSSLTQARELSARSCRITTYEPCGGTAWDDAYGRFLALLGKTGGA